MPKKQYRKKRNKGVTKKEVSRMIKSGVSNYSGLRFYSINPKKVYRRMIYDEKVEMTTPPSDLATTVFYTGNSIHDPYLPLGGVTVQGFEQIMGTSTRPDLGLYRRYTVLKAHIVVNFVATGLGAQYVGINLTEDNTNITDASQLMGNKSCKFKVMTGMSANGYTTVKHSVDLAKWHGSDVRDDDRFSGTRTTDPSDKLYFMIWAADVTNTASTYLLSANVRISYDVMFSEPLTLAQGTS